ncbi:dirigent protein 22-like [Andrographis paniculata]|uniref:dirigent protein 22-like n=1 Tax=Andrographis paniculata TaxID=175694 RepID=UPI0021E6E71B|nr:dirigent protein 22-like [Andrographis paniculata]
MDSQRQCLSTTLTTLALIFIVLMRSTAQAQARSETGSRQVSIAQDPKSVEDWFKNLPNAKERTTKLHFYFHDIVTAKNPTVVTVAESNLTKTSPTSFGLVRVMDDPLRVGPQPESKLVGRAQGIYVAAGLEEVALLLTLNYVFTDGPYNGSTLSVLGHNPILHTYREIPILGGSGVFRLARGIATAKTVWFDLKTQNAVVEYNLIVLHY